MIILMILNASLKIDSEMHMAAPLLSDIWETHDRKDRKGKYKTLSGSLKGSDQKLNNTQ